MRGISRKHTMIRIRSETVSPAPTAPTAPPAPAPLTLADLARSRIAESMVIEGIDEESAPSGLRRRLLETGFTVGCPVRFVISTPFGDPLVFSLRGTSIALRQSEARCVRVRAATAS